MKDLISRDVVLDLIADYDLSMGQVVRGIHALQSFTSTEEELEKIKEEIEDAGAYEQEVNGKTEFLKGINYCLSIIDKYKAKVRNKE